ncbi:hypothetical protein GWN42_31400 [candidate division KSB1 bacterium]|nr:hypothetical protein [Phycisphaerae bacterium]NIQ92566.1 hypothetical protein [Deltaproteobacteria bacterium]NIV97176.1 hypothetical protein [candidate division KSB1 bacterium]
MSLRKQIEADLAKSLENPNDFGLPVTIIYPDGSEQTLDGKIVYGWESVEPETQQIIYNDAPIVTLRISSMNQEIKAGQKIGFRIAKTPDPDASTVTFISEHGRVVHSRSIGFVKIFLHEAEQV